MTGITYRAERQPFRKFFEDRNGVPWPSTGSMCPANLRPDGQVGPWDYVMFETIADWLDKEVLSEEMMERLVKAAMDAATETVKQHQASNNTGMSGVQTHSETTTTTHYLSYARAQKVVQAVLEAYLVAK